MRKTILLLCLALLLVLGVAVAPAGAKSCNPMGLNLPEDFSYIGAPVHSYAVPSGHVVHYIDQGDQGWPVAVLIGGWGTGAQAYELTAFARDLQFKLHIRVICVERNGFGMTLFQPADASGHLITSTDDAALALADPVKTREMYASDVLSVLKHLKVRKFSIVAISGGGPFLGELARQGGCRVRSIHLAVAVYQSSYSGPVYPDPGFLDTMHSYIINPMWWWDMTGTTADMIPGWQDRAYDEGAWAAFVRGQDADPHAVGMDYTIFTKKPPDVSMVAAPVFTYYGGEDSSVDYSQRDAWVAAFSSSGKVIQRNYAHLGHDVQYRHWDQILLDIAGYGDYLIIAYHGRTKVIPESWWPKYEKRGAILGMQAWATAKLPVD